MKDKNKFDNTQGSFNTFMLNNLFALKIPHQIWDIPHYFKRFFTFLHKILFFAKKYFLKISSFLQMI